MERWKDLSGQRFGKLVAIRYLGIPKGFNRTRWTCRCDCGKLVDYSTTQLTAGKATSCGCEKEYLKEGKPVTMPIYLMPRPLEKSIAEMRKNFKPIDKSQFTDDFMFE